MTRLFIYYGFATQISLGYSSSTVEQKLHAAAGNLTAFKTEIISSWVEGPQFRGTSSILWSCIVTLIACIYTAIHLNIPPAHEGNWHFIWRKAKWVGLALFGPELVLFCAYRQFSEARKLVKELNELRGTQRKVNSASIKSQEDLKEPAETAGHRQDNSQSSRVDVEMGKSNETAPPLKFPLKYGFFVVMGGITTRNVTELTDTSNPPQTLTPDAVIFFARYGVFFDISSEEIMDKSKANVVGKILICVQVIWFAIQVIARLTAGYPLALIEVHTVVHVLCALVMYILWWEKPQDISEAIAQSTSRHLDILASLYVHSLDRKDVEARSLRFYGTRDVTSQMQNFQKVVAETDDQSHQVVIIGVQPPTISNHKAPKDVRRENTTCEIFGGQALLHSLIGPESDRSPRYLSAKDIRRWDCLAELLCRSDMQDAVNRLSSARPISHDSNDDSKPGVNVSKLLTSINPQIADSLISHQPNFKFISDGLRLKSTHFIISWHRDPLLLLILVILPIAYGGIHLAAWNFQFASYIEGLLWKIACIYIMATYIGVRAVEEARDFTKLSIWSIPGFLMAMFFYLIASTLHLLFFLSRIYLLVQSFIGLRHVPIGVYAALPWVQNIPHI